ncbi:hypothetical protein LPJ63_001523 [Coemansia sp. RSA 2711]|nr:hypothetical protein LPJ63_001523 [Coemansia sp. RSA 2711]
MFGAAVAVYLLVDYDPDGAHIFKVYSEGGLNSSSNCLPNAHWIGLHCDLTCLGRWGLGPSEMSEFTRRDMQLALRLLRHWKDRPKYRRRMAKMSYYGKKVELEAATQRRSTLLDYIYNLVGGL